MSQLNIHEPRLILLQFCKTQPDISGRLGTNQVCSRLALQYSLAQLPPGMEIIKNKSECCIGLDCTGRCTSAIHQIVIF